MIRRIVLALALAAGGVVFTSSPAAAIPSPSQICANLIALKEYYNPPPHGHWHVLQAYYSWLDPAFVTTYCRFTWPYPADENEDFIICEQNVTIWWNEEVTFGPQFCDYYH